MTISIRCSMLPGWSDCARRAAAKQFGPLIEQAGFPLRRLMPSVGAAIGTAVHLALQSVMSARVNGIIDTLDGVVSDGMRKFEEEIAPGCEWDATTKSVGDARQQIKSLTQALLAHVPDGEPSLVEQQLQASLPDGWLLTGKPDLLAAGHLDDWKTGSVIRNYMAQCGSYVLLVEANGFEVTGAGTIFAKRVRPGTVQPPAVRIPFDLNTSRRAAWAAIREIQRDSEQFQQTADPFSFRANPMSLMCSEKYCAAWGTEFCTVHLKKEQTDG